MERINRAENRKYHYIYKTVRILDGAYYIGLHSTDRLDDGYIGSGTRLWNSIHKHGREAHQKQILEFLPTRQSIKLREAEIVNTELLNDPMCMNINIGGTIGYSPPMSEVTKQKLREARKNFKHTKESKAKISAKVKGRKMTPEQIEKWKAKRVGFKYSEESKQKMSAAKKGKKLSSEHIANRAKAQSKACTVDGVMIYPSLKLLEEALGRGKRGTQSPNFKFV